MTNVRYTTHTNDKRKENVRQPYEKTYDKRKTNITQTYEERTTNGRFKFLDKLKTSVNQKSTNVSPTYDTPPQPPWSQVFGDERLQ